MKKSISVLFILFSAMFSLTVIHETVRSAEESLLIKDRDPQNCGFYYQVDQRYVKICKEKREWNVGVGTASKALRDIPIFIIISISALLITQVFKSDRRDAIFIEKISQSYLLSSIISMIMAVPISFTFINTSIIYGKIIFHIFIFIGAFIFTCFSARGGIENSLFRMRKEKIFSISSAIIMVIMAIMCILEHWNRNVIEL